MFRKTARGGAKITALLAIFAIYLSASPTPPTDTDPTLTNPAPLLFAYFEHRNNELEKTKDDHKVTPANRKAFQNQGSSSPTQSTNPSTASSSEQLAHQISSLLQKELESSLAHLEETLKRMQSSSASTQQRPTEQRPTFSLSGHRRTPSPIASPPSCPPF